MRNPKVYAFVFAGIVCLACSFVLTMAAQGLQERQELNLKIDKQKNILQAVGIPEDGSSLAAEDVQEAYDENIREFVLNPEGKVVRGMKPTDITDENPQGLLPLYARVTGDTINSYVIPVSGKGLWSTIYGYLAIEPDARTVRGITFYKHGETPGLGGEVEKDWFQNNFKGKKVFTLDGSLQSVSVAKGKVKEVISEEEWDHYVDGISGATITGKGVTQFLRSDLEHYQPFFAHIHNYSEEG